MRRKLALTAVSTLLALVCLASTRPEKPAFTCVEDAVGFIVQRVESDDYGGLCAALVERGSDNPAILPERRWVFDVLKDLHRRKPLPKLSAAESFPADKAQFTLGGHGGPFEHVSIMFYRRERGWVLWDIAVCK